MTELTTNPQKPGDEGWEALPWTAKATKLYEQGADDVEVCRAISLTLKDFNDLYNNPADERFKKHIDFGRMLAKAWWIQQARENLWNRNFKVDLWNSVMRNRYGWNGKPDEDGLQIPEEYRDLDKLRTEAYNAIKKLGKRLGTEFGDRELLQSVNNLNDLPN